MLDAKNLAKAAYGKRARAVCTKLLSNLYVIIVYEKQPVQVRANKRVKQLVWIVSYSPDSCLLLAIDYLLGRCYNAGKRQDAT